MTRRTKIDKLGAKLLTEAIARRSTALRHVAFNAAWSRRRPPLSISITAEAARRVYLSSANGRYNPAMADAADPAHRTDERRNAFVHPRDYTVEHLIEFFDEMAAKLVRAGVRSDRLVDALKLVAIRTEILRHEREYAGPERRGSGRPWSHPARRRPGEPLR